MIGSNLGDRNNMLTKILSTHQETAPHYVGLKLSIENAQGAC